MTKNNPPQKKESTGKKNKITLNKQKIKGITRILVLVLIFSFLLAGGVAFGMVVAGLHGTPEFSIEQLRSPLPSEIKDDKGNLVVRLDREQYREEVGIEEIPLHVKQSFIAIEDVNFYNHMGFDFRGIMRAASNNFRETGNPFRGSQGGSTITQQLVKNAFLSPRQQLERKIQELWLSIQVERAFTKDEILELYLNNAVYFNHNAYGIQAGSQVYFDKHVKDLTIAESALLAGVIRHPSRLSPYNNPLEAKNRQLTVLNAMREQGFINETEYETAKNTDVEILLAELPERHYPFPHYIDYVIYEELVPILAAMTGETSAEEARSFAENLIYHGGLKIHTYLDQDMQRHTESVINNPENFPVTTADQAGVTQPQAAAVLLDPNTGGIRALVGGRDYGVHNMLNRVVSRRQPGSAMKPISIYAPAIEENLISPGSVIDDAPTVFSLSGSGQGYTPENFGRSFAGLITAREALVRSYNVPAVQVYTNVLGTDKAAAYTENFGITTMTQGDKVNPSAAIGGWEHGVKPVEMAGAYGTLANKGIKVNPSAIKYIEDRNGEMLYQSPTSTESVVSEETAWLVSDMLKDVAEWGTASRINLGRPVAAKTGTSQSERDGWLAAYTPDYVLTVWMGYDRDEGTGNTIPGHWQYTTNFVNRILGHALEGTEVKNFNRPPGITGPIAISSKSGLRPSELTPEAYITSDYFKQHMVPSTTCEAFVEVEVCVESGKLISDFCPEYSFETRVMLERRPYITTDNRWTHGAGRAPADVALMAPDPEDICDYHDEGYELVDKGISAEIAEDESYITLSWNKLEEPEVKYNLYRRGAEEGAFTLLGTFQNDNYVDRDITPGATYLYYMNAVNKEGDIIRLGWRLAVTVSKEDMLDDEDEKDPDDETSEDQKEEKNEKDEDDKEDKENSGSSSQEDKENDKENEDRNHQNNTSNNSNHNGVGNEKPNNN